MLRRTLVAITVLIAMNISLYTITVWIPTIFVNSGIDVDKSILMTAVIMIGAPVGIFIAALIIDHFPRRLFGSALLIIIAVLGYIYSIQTTEWAILTHGPVMIFFIRMCASRRRFISRNFGQRIYACVVRVSLMPSDGSSQSSRPMALRHY